MSDEPNFRRDQKDGLLRDLGNYMRTLKAVHSGADLESAITNCLGYRSEDQGFMVGVHINPVSGLPSGFTKIMYFLTLSLENLALSSDNNEDLIYCLEGWNQALRCQKVKMEIGHCSRNRWQVISPVEAVGYVVVDALLTVQNKTYEKHSILVAKSVKGEEEIPDGAVALLTPDMPDVLSHVSLRAMNSKVCSATRFDPKILAVIQSLEGSLLSIKPTSSEIVYR